MVSLMEVEFEGKRAKWLTLFIKVTVQKFGNFLSSMVMPNISAFIAWGLITALFIPSGFLPNESLAKMVTPMVTFLLPLLIGYTGGAISRDLKLIPTGLE